MSNIKLFKNEEDFNKVFPNTNNFDNYRDVITDYYNSIKNNQTALDYIDILLNHYKYYNKIDWEKKIEIDLMMKNKYNYENSIYNNFRLSTKDINKYKKYLGLVKDYENGKDPLCNQHTENILKCFVETKSKIDFMNILDLKIKEEQEKEINKYGRILSRREKKNIEYYSDSDDSCADFNQY